MSVVHPWSFGYSSEMTHEQSRQARQCPRKYPGVVGLFAVSTEVGIEVT
jgi:hypothetical protein